MQETRILMGMPVTVEITDTLAHAQHIEDTFAYFHYIDNTFSTYKPDSEISHVNAGRIAPHEYSADMRAIFALAEEMKQVSRGYFNIRSPHGIDPSGVVKGWAIHRAAERLKAKGLQHFYVEAGGDIAAYGMNAEGKPWRVGIRNPFNTEEIVKVVECTNCGIATSGTYIRGGHIYNPHSGFSPVREIMSLTVIGPDVDVADRYATAAFAMGQQGIQFIEDTPGLEGYSIDVRGTATYTSGFIRYVPTR